MAQRAAALSTKTLRRDAWWWERTATVTAIALFVGYATWGAAVNSNYYFEPYLSPLYSPCLADICEHTTWRLFGSWWALTPAILILWIPSGFRITCYFFRRSYYRAFFGSPPACAVRDDFKRYSGETKFPFVLQNLHRYFFYLAIVVAGFLWYDAYLGFRFEDGWGMGVGTVIFVADAALLSLYLLSCHSCRHLVGGSLDEPSRSPVRYRAWTIVSRLNKHHGLYFWVSLWMVAVGDIYVRLLVAGTIRDLRIF